MTALRVTSIVFAIMALVVSVLYIADAGMKTDDRKPEEAANARTGASVAAIAAVAWGSLAICAAIAEAGQRNSARPYSPPAQPQYGAGPYPHGQGPANPPGAHYRR
jgi:hypothetical protein